MRRFCTISAPEQNVIQVTLYGTGLGTSCQWNEITGTGMKRAIKRVVGNLLEQHFDKAECKYTWE